MASLAGALGLCRRAGKLVIGAPMVTEALHRGRVKLVLFAADLSGASREKIEKLAEHRNIPVKVCLLTKVQLGEALGKTGEVGTVAIPAEFLDLVTASL